MSQSPIPIAMANSTTLLCLLLFFLSCAANSMPVTSLEEKQSHFRYYWHDIASGPNPTAITITQAPETKKAPTYFGTVVVIDDALTTGPDMKSKLVGRAQGLYTMTGIEKAELLMAMNFVFTNEEYNGSTISILGHNAVDSPVREMPIVGGTGLFRFARGYVQARTYSFAKTGDAVVEYNIFVNHY